MKTSDAYKVKLEDDAKPKMKDNLLPMVTQPGRRWEPSTVRPQYHGSHGFPAYHREYISVACQVAFGPGGHVACADRLCDCTCHSTEHYD